MKAWLLAIGIGFGAALWLSAGHPVDPTRKFVDRMLEGIEAEPIECPGEVLDLAQNRDVKVICASFEGDFDRFEYLWSIELLRGAMHPSKDNGPHTLPQTAWETTGEVHERVYTVGETALGVRVSTGYVMLAYR